MANQEKSDVTQVDTIEPAPAQNDDALSGNEAMVHQLEITGEEVGMTWRSFLAAMGMALSYNAYVFTLLMPPAVLSYINADIGPDPSYTWISISWNLGGAIFVTIGGRLSDILGRRYFFLAGAGLLLVGSIIGATGQNIHQMIASGAVFGCGSGFLEMAYGAVQEIVPNEWRMVTIGLFDAAAVIAQMMPLVAWVIIKYTANWRNAYYVIIGFEAFTCIFLFFFYNPPKFSTKHATDGRTVASVIKDFDWIGLAIFTAGCTLFIVGINAGGNLHPWKSAATLCPIVIGLVLLITLGFYEGFAKIKEPLLPARLFKQVRHFTMPLVVVSVVGMQYYSNAVLWPRLSQLIWAHDEITKGLYSEVIPLGSIVGGILVTGSKRLGHQRWQVVFCAALQTGCVGALASSTIDNPAKSIVLTFFVSLTVTIIMMNCFVLIGFGIVYQEDIGTAAGLAGTSRLLFGAVATAIFSNVTNQRYTSALTRRITEAVAPFGLSKADVTKLIGAAKLNTAAAYAKIAGVTPEIRAAAVLANKEAYLEGAHLSYLVALAFGCIAVIAALFIPSIDERKWNKKTVAVQETDRKHLEEKNMQTA